jgi:sugar-specific transcriptional regulator TrmB
MLSIDDKITSFLKSLGLSETEQSLYLEGLSIPEASVSDLIRKTRTNRTTAYHALGTLQQKGMASETKVQGKLVYIMTTPENLGNVLNRQKASIEKQRQELLSLANLFPIFTIETQEHTYIEKFEGLEGVKNAIEKALYCRSGQWEIIAPKDNFFSQVEHSYARYFMETRKSHDIKARSLWEKGFKSSSKLSMEDIIMRKPRYLPPEFTGKFKSVIIIFDQKALFITSAAQQSAVIVESDEIIGTLRVLFDAIWSISEKA